MPNLNDLKNKETRFKNQKQRPYYQDASSSSPVVDNTNNLGDNRILSIETDRIKNWIYHDRPENELGDIEQLAKEFIDIGQQQPCIVRAIPNSPNYELIAGERRWHAAKKANIKLNVIVKELDDQNSAIIQASENASRKNLSDYARGMSYTKLINDNIINQSELSNKLNISRQKMSKLLSYTKIPTVIITAVDDWSQVSCDTAEKIKQLSSKGENYINALIQFAEKIRDASIGMKKIEQLVLQKISLPDTPEKRSQKECSSDGRHLFTWRTDNNNSPSLHFPKDISQNFMKDNFNIEEFSNDIKKALEKQFNNF